MNRVLILCNTVYQVIVATNLKFTVYEKCIVDIIISDHINNNVDLAKRIENSGYFNKVFTAETFNFARKKGRYNRKNLKEEVVFQLKRKKIFENIIKIKCKYDILLVSNFDEFSNALYEYNKNYLNPNIKLYLFEDGFSSYCVFGEYYLHRLKPNDIKKKIKTNLLRNKFMEDEILGHYVFNPSFMQWKAPFPCIKMDKIDKNNKKLVTALNKIFDYEKVEDKYDKPIIFFEESYYEEGIDIDDIGIVEKISSYVGKDKIMIKVHPRNKRNRFKELGYSTNSNTAIPWEIIILNNDFSNKILISIASGSIIMPYILFGIKTKSISLLKTFDIKFGKTANKYNDFLINVIFKKNNDVVFMPNNLEELMNYINENGES